MNLYPEQITQAMRAYVWIWSNNGTLLERTLPNLKDREFLLCLWYGNVIGSIAPFKLTSTRMHHLNRMWKVLRPIWLANRLYDNSVFEIDRNRWYGNPRP